LKNANGEGSIRRRADGRWEARYTVPLDNGGHVRRSVFGRTRADARDRLRVALAERERHVVGVPATETVATYLTTWLTGVSSSLRPTTWQSYESLVRRQIGPRLGHVQLRKLRPQHIAVMARDMQSDGLSAKTVRNALGVLHKACDRAVKWRQLADNPCDGVDLPTRTRREMTALTGEQARAVLDAAHDDELCAFVDADDHRGVAPGRATRAALA
jgi:hypothetical protein